jgi:hypothetical protein
MTLDCVRADRQPLLGVALPCFEPADRFVRAELAANLTIDAMASAPPLAPADKLEWLQALFAVLRDDDLHAMARTTRNRPSQSHAEMRNGSNTLTASPPGSASPR